MISSCYTFLGETFRWKSYGSFSIATKIPVKILCFTGPLCVISFLLYLIISVLLYIQHMDDAMALAVGAKMTEAGMKTGMEMGSKVGLDVMQQRVWTNPSNSNVNDLTQQHNVHQLDDLTQLHPVNRMNTVFYLICSWSVIYLDLSMQEYKTYKDMFKHNIDKIINVINLALIVYSYVNMQYIPLVFILMGAAMWGILVLLRLIQKTNQAKIAKQRKKEKAQRSDKEMKRRRREQSKSVVQSPLVS